MPHRHIVPVDVLAQFQFGHRKPRRWAAQDCNEHLHRSGFFCAHYCCPLKHVQEGRKTGHGNVTNSCKANENSTVSFWKLIRCFCWQVHIQNATLAGGVAMGTAAEFMITPYGSLIVGFCIGIISTFGYLHVTVSLSSVYFLHSCHSSWELWDIVSLENAKKMFLIEPLTAFGTKKYG